MVLDSDKTANLITSWCEESGGYYIQRTPDFIQLRVPNSVLSELKSFLQSISVELLHYNQESYSVTSRISELKSGIKAREDVLDQNLYYITVSDVEGTLSLEQEIRRLQEEIDRFRGELRKLEHDANMVKIHIDITFKSRTISKSNYSPFEWVNSVDFYASMAMDMTYDLKGFTGPETVIPKGFATIDKKPILRAISSEGGRFILNRFDNYPKQTRNFWGDTLFNYLEQKGYLQIGEVFEYTPEGEDSFLAAKWAVPYGNSDYIYVTGIRLKGSKIEVLQITNETRFYDKYFNE